MISKGIQKVNKELEVDRFLRTMIQVRILFRVLFTKTERYLMSHNRRFVIDKDSSRYKKTPRGRIHREADLGKYCRFLLSDCGLYDTMQQTKRGILEP